MPVDDVASKSLAGVLATLQGSVQLKRRGVKNAC
jgi:hypothetical protein